MIKLRTYEEGDYEKIAAWWKGHGLPPISEGALPGISYFGFDDEHGDIAVGFMDTSTFGNICYFYGIISNPDAPARKVNEAYDTVLDALIQCAEVMGYGLMMAHPFQSSMKFKAKQHGFVENHDSVAQMYLILKPEVPV